MKQPTGVWNFRQRWEELKDADGREVGEMLSSFLEQFPSDPAIWQRVGAQGKVTVSVTSWFSEENGTALFEPSLLARLVARGASLMVDVWKEVPAQERT
jgi:hypothetical protein